jgi:hypothetical protein
MTIVIAIISDKDIVCRYGAANVLDAGERIGVAPAVQRAAACTGVVGHALPRAACRGSRPGSPRHPGHRCWRSRRRGSRP